MINYEDNKDNTGDFTPEKVTAGVDNPSAEIIGSFEDEAKKIDVYEDYEFPSLVLRMKALFIDGLVLLLIFALGATAIDIAGGAPNWVRGSILIFMLYFYDPIMISFAGGTLGHFAMRLRVKNINDPNKKLMLIEALFRFLIKGLLGWISFLTVTGNAKKRAIHDFVSGSIVIMNKVS